MRVGVTLKVDTAPDTVPGLIQEAVGTVINWENERYRKFGLWKRWPLHNIAFQRARFDAGLISLETFDELRKMFLTARQGEE
jgi:hypothetical protein